MIGLPHIYLATFDAMKGMHTPAVSIPTRIAPIVKQPKTNDAARPETHIKKCKKREAKGYHFSLVAGLDAVMVEKPGSGIH